MAKSPAKKYRAHLLRTTGKDVTRSRAEVPDFSTHERKTETKKGKLEKLRKKTDSKKRQSYRFRDDDRSFFYAKKRRLTKFGLYLE